jgi:hypothetical protein
LARRARAPITKRVEKWPTTHRDFSLAIASPRVASRLPLHVAQSVFNRSPHVGANAVGRETVSIDRNFANDIELVVTASSLFIDSGSWLIHILTVIWGS